VGQAVLSTQSGSSLLQNRVVPLSQDCVFVAESTSTRVAMTGRHSMYSGVTAWVGSAILLAVLHVGADVVSSKFTFYQGCNSLGGLGLVFKLISYTDHDLLLLRRLLLLQPLRRLLLYYYFYYFYDYYDYYYCTVDLSLIEDDLLDARHIGCECNRTIPTRFLFFLHLIHVDLHLNTVDFERLASFW